MVKTSAGTSDSIRSTFPVDKLWEALSGNQTLSQIHIQFTESLGMPKDQCARLIDSILNRLTSKGAVGFSRTTPAHVIDIVDVAASVPDDSHRLRLLYIDEMNPDEKKGFGFPRARRIYLPAGARTRSPQG